MLLFDSLILGREKLLSLLFGTFDFGVCVWVFEWKSILLGFTYNLGRSFVFCLSVCYMLCAVKV